MNINDKNCNKCDGTGKYLVGDANAFEVDCDCGKTFWSETARLIDEYRKEGNNERAEGLVDSRIIYNRYSTK